MGSCIKDFMFAKSQAQLSTAYTAVNADRRLPRCVLAGYIQLLCASCYFCQDQSFTFTWVTGSDTAASNWAGDLLAHSPEDLHVGTSGSRLLARLITMGTPRFWLTVSKYLPLIRFAVQVKNWPRKADLMTQTGVQESRSRCTARSATPSILLKDTASGAASVHSTCSPKVKNLISTSNWCL